MKTFLERAQGWLKEHVLSDRQFVILCYHGVSNNIGEEDPAELKVSIANFRLQMEYLAQNYQVASLYDVIAQIQHGRLRKGKQVIVTFDDGYENNYLNAYPILKKYRIPATIFLTSDYVDTQKAFWWDRLRHILWSTPYKQIELEIAEKRYQYSLETYSTKRDAFFDIHERLRRLKPRIRWEYVAALNLALHARADDYTHDDFPLRWEQIGMMDQTIISFGVHTCSHPVLDALSPEEVFREILDSREIIQQHLHKSVSLFCYPYGNIGDFNEMVKGILKELDFSCACSLYSGANDEHTDLFALQRIGIGNWEKETFQGALYQAFYQA